MQQRDYYAILNVNRDASKDEIKQAYRKLAMIYHPDKNLGDKAAEDRFKEISEAYEILRDAQIRRYYDEALAAQEMLQVIQERGRYNPNTLAETNYDLEYNSEEVSEGNAYYDRQAKSVIQERKFNPINVMIGVLISLAVMAMFIVPAVREAPQKARAARAQIEIENIKTALEQYAIITGGYPTTEQGLSALWRAPSPAPPNWDGPYVDSPNFIDPWNNPYVYHQPSTHHGYDYDLYSLGRDGKVGGVGFDADIHYEHIH